MTQLKTFRTTPIQGGRLGVECPHCSNKVVVSARKWLHSHPGGTRPCTFCFKASFMNEGRREVFVQEGL